MYRISSDSLTIFCIAESKDEFIDWINDLRENKTNKDDTEQRSEDTVVINAELVSEVDASGIQLVLGFANKLTQLEKKLKIINLQPEVKKSLTLTGCRSYVELDEEGGSGSYE